MAKLYGAERDRRVRRRRSLDRERQDELRGERTFTLEPDAEEVRRRRIERLERSANTTAGRVAESPNMTTESHVTVQTSRQSSSRKRREHRRSPDERRHRRRTESAAKEEIYIYGPPKERKAPPVLISERRTLGRDGASDESSSSESDREPVRRSRAARDRPKGRKVKVIYVNGKEAINTIKVKERRVRGSPDTLRRPESVHRSSTHHAHRRSAPDKPPASPPKRRDSGRLLHSETRALLKRSNTISSYVPTTRSFIPSISPTKTKRSSIFGSFFAPPALVHTQPERLVSCLTCLDDVPKSKVAKLKCTHYMCRPCLKRIFKLSVNDPQHMPPKCCTSDHIPLNHVENLFDDNFKKTWNRKFHEFSTKNRIYCPARRCGEWIKPENIHKEDGKKYGKCGRCKTKVCCLCNSKWHGTKDCPKDEETNRLLETAKQAGWQRCFSCRTMIELKEGCNHMTCHCTAEFCMICGLKWKTCNCPWFNYEAVEADRLQHMQIPVDPRPPPHPHIPPEEAPEELPRRLRRPRPNTYDDALGERRRQERIDEAMAHRLQRVAISDDDDYQGGIGEIHGIGNAAGHFMNQDYVRAAQNILTGNYDQAAAAANYVMGVANARGDLRPRRMADRYPVPERMRPPSPPPVQRRHSMREKVYDTLPIVARRARTNYETGSAPERAPSIRREPKTSVLAGLGGRGNRVGAWRSHVEPGVEPEEGMLSM